MNAILVPPKPFYNHSIVFKICEVKPLKRQKRGSSSPPPELETAFWPGVCYFGSPPSIFWMNGETTPYDGKRLYTLDHLAADLAAGELLVNAIRANQLFTSPDELLNPALVHVFAAVHQGALPKEDWLEWLCSIIDMIPQQPLNSRNKPKKSHRGLAGVAKSSGYSRAEFAAKLPLGLTSKEVTLLWRDHKRV